MELSWCRSPPRRPSCPLPPPFLPDTTAHPLTDSGAYCHQYVCDGFGVINHDCFHRPIQLADLQGPLLLLVLHGVLQAQPTQLPAVALGTCIPPKHLQLQLTAGCMMQGRHAQCKMDAYPIAEHVVVQSLPSLQPDPFLWVFIQEKQPKITGWKTERTSVGIALGWMRPVRTVQQHPVCCSKQPQLPRAGGKPEWAKSWQMSIRVGVLHLFIHRKIHLKHAYIMLTQR